MSDTAHVPARLLALAALAGFTATGGLHGLLAFAHSWWIHPEHRPTWRR